MRGACQVADFTLMIRATRGRSIDGWMDGWMNGPWHLCTYTPGYWVLNLLHFSFSKVYHCELSWDLQTLRKESS